MSPLYRHGEEVLLKKLMVPHGSRVAQSGRVNNWTHPSRNLIPWQIAIDAVMQKMVLYLEVPAGYIPMQASLLAHH